MHASRCRLASTLEFEPAQAAMAIKDRRIRPFRMSERSHLEELDDAIEFRVWDEIVGIPQAHDGHAQESNDRSMAHARRRALDLEMMVSGGPAFPKPTIVLFWNSGVAEKVEHPWPEKTLWTKRGLPRPPDRSRQSYWNKDDVLVDKQEVRKTEDFVSIGE